MKELLDEETIWMVEFEKVALQASLLSKLGLFLTSTPSPATVTLTESLHCAYVLLMLLWVILKEQMWSFLSWWGGFLPKSKSKMKLTSELFFNKFIYFIFIYFWLCWVFVDACRLSLVAVSGSYSSLRFTGFLLRCLLLLRSTGCRCMGFSSCDTWTQ